VFVPGAMTIFSAFFSVFTSELANYVHSPLSPLAGENISLLSALRASQGSRGFTFCQHPQSSQMMGWPGGVPRAICRIEYE